MAITTPEKSWQLLLDQLAQELPRPTFTARLGQARFLGLEDGIFTVAVPDAFTCAWLDQRLKRTAARQLAGSLKRPVELRFVVAGPDEAQGQALQDLRGQPEVAWQAVHRQLAAALTGSPAAAWLAQVRFLAYYQNRVILALPSDEAHQALTERVQDEARRQLAALLEDPALTIEWVVAPLPDAGPSPAPPEPSLPPFAPQAAGLSAAEAEVLIRPVCASLREAITRPRSVVVVPAYLLRWLPYLGVDQGWFLVAMRQAFYQAEGQKVSAENCGQTFTVGRAWLARWSGLGDRKVWGYLKRLEAGDQAGNFLAWFLRGTPADPGKPKTYTFRCDMPLTPGDVEALSCWLADNGIEKTPLETLQAALARQPGELLSYPPPPPAGHHHQLAPRPRTVPEVVLEAAGLGRADPPYLPVQQLADELAAHLQSPSDNLVISHYFLLEWLRRLGRVPAWIVTVLRDRGYFDHATGARRDRVRLAHGYRELADLLRLSERQVESWLPPLPEMVRRQTPARPGSHWARRQAKRALVSRFLNKEGQVAWDGAGATAYEFQVRLEDPLTPPHQQILQRLEALIHDCLLAGDLAPLAGLAAALEGGLVREEHRPDAGWSANDTTTNGSGARSAQLPLPLGREGHSPRPANDTGNGRFDARIARLKALLNKHLNPKALLTIQHLLHQHLEAWQQGAQADLDGVGEQFQRGWDWDVLLGYTAASPQARARIQGSPQLRRRFLGQALYGYAHRAAGGPGIQAPFQFAAQRCSDSPPPEYLELADLPPDQLAGLLREGLAGEVGVRLSASARRAARALAANDFLLVIAEAARPEAAEGQAPG